MTAPTPPTFQIIGDEPSDAAIAALARLLIAHAERELADEAAKVDDGNGQGDDGQGDGQGGE